MSDLAPLIADLALILACASVTTLLFKKLKQPLVLGYVVAGFLASPHLELTPSVVDTTSVHTWADIGVIFLLFALGLEFSFKKIVKVGTSAVIAACTIIFCMIFIGVSIGTFFGWERMDCIFLGGMLAMSSTTIIYKAFDDLGLFKKQFTQLVMSILILEDVLAIVLMVMLSTMAVSNNVDGAEMLLSIGKLAFFLILWFVVGLYLIPLLLKYARHLLNDETMLVVSLGLCFLMVVVAAQTGFSAAFGAFIMGSILAETVEAERIDHLVKPVKDLFGAIFFVSVGMMVDPTMIVEYAVPIVTITSCIILGQCVFGSLGVLLSGQPLKTSMQCGFSLAQIGEFAFIIASLGVSLNVTSDFLYPIVVAVSVITTFLTPYMIRLAEPASDYVERRLPAHLLSALERYTTSTHTMGHESLWRKYVMNLLRITVVYGIVCIAIAALSQRLLLPLAMHYFPAFWARLIVAAVTVLLMAPFLRAIMIKKNHSEEFKALWMDRTNRAPLLASILLRVIVAIIFVMAVIGGLLDLSWALLFGVALILVCAMVMSRRLKKRSIQIERVFMKNLRQRDMRAEYLGSKKPEYAGRLLSKDVHLSDFVVPANASWVGRDLMELDFGRRFGVNVVSVLRGTHRINIPKATEHLYPCDKIQVIGTDAELLAFGQMFIEENAPSEEQFERGEMVLRQFAIDAKSRFLGLTLRESGIRDNHHCLIVGVERDDKKLHAANSEEPFLEGDVVWAVGEREDVNKLAGADEPV